MLRLVAGHLITPWFTRCLDTSANQQDVLNFQENGSRPCLSLCAFHDRMTQEAASGTLRRMTIRPPMSASLPWPVGVGLSCWRPAPMAVLSDRAESAERACRYPKQGRALAAACSISSTPAHDIPTAGFHLATCGRLARCSNHRRPDPGVKFCRLISVALSYPPFHDPRGSQHVVAELLFDSAK
jgi:hypothetical protein